MLKFTDMSVEEVTYYIGMVNGEDYEGIEMPNFIDSCIYESFKIKVCNSYFRDTETNKTFVHRHFDCKAKDFERYYLEEL